MRKSDRFITDALSHVSPITFCTGICFLCNAFSNAENKPSAEQSMASNFNNSNNSVKAAEVFRIYVFN